MLTFVLLVLSILLIYIHLKRSLLKQKVGVCGENPQMIFGNLLQSGLLTGKTTFYQMKREYQKRFGDKFVFWFGSYPCIIFCLPEHAQKVLNDRHNFDQSPLFLPNFDLLCPHAILAHTGSRWKRHIRVMLPVFKKSKIIHHSDIIVNCVDRWIDRYFHDGCMNREILNQCHALTMNIIGWIAFDYDLDSAVDKTMKKAFDTFNYYATLIVTMPWIPRCLTRLYLRLNWKYQNAREIIHQLTQNIVEHELNNPKNGIDDCSKNLIASMVSSLNEQANDEEITSGLRREEIFDEILGCMLAGYETTASALAWFMFFISKHPQVQQKLKDELREHDLLPMKGGDELPALNYQIVDQLSYCECVTKEVFRLAPVAGGITRMALHDTIVDDVPIRQGQTVLIALQNISTDPRYWHHGDSTHFIPERFLTEDKDHHPFAMLPFGGGHRACIGQNLAWLELKMIIIRLMQHRITFEDTPENIGGYEEQLTCYPKTMAIRIRIDHDSREKNA